MELDNNILAALIAVVSGGLGYAFKMIMTNSRQNDIIITKIENIFKEISDISPQCKRHEEKFENLRLQVQALEIENREHQKISDIISAMPEIVYQLKEIAKEFSQFKIDFRESFKDYSSKLDNISEKVTHTSHKVETHEIAISALRHGLKERGIDIIK